jgi:hypothetical protein
MSIFTKDVTSQLKNVGDLWTTSIDGSCISFYAIFDAENKLETDGTGMTVIIQGSSLICETSIAKQFQTNQVIEDQDGLFWYVREHLKQDDGYLSRCSLTEQPT